MLQPHPHTGNTFKGNSADLCYVNNVHWKITEHALDLFQCNDQRRLILCLRDKLPLQTSKFHPHHCSPLCPSCQKDPEDKWHFLAFMHIEKCHLFDKLKHQLAAVATKYSLHPSIFTVFWLGLLAIRNATSYPDVINDLPPALQPIIQFQTRLGWEQLYYGWLTLQWDKAINTLHPHLTTPSTRILAHLITAVWHYFLSLWQLRNQHLHNDAGCPSLPNYRQAVTTIYELQIQLPPVAQQALFQQPLEMMLEQPPAILCLWIEQSHKYVKQQLKAAHTRAKLNTPDIHLFFCPISQAANDLNPPWRPCYTAPVWVFFVPISPREITLKAQAFSLLTSMTM